MSTITEKDRELLRQKGISEEKVEQQLKQFEQGFPFADIRRPATIGDGIARVEEAEKERLIDIYQKSIRGNKTVMKFVPASGAATRMFKSMYEFRNADASQQALLANEKPYKEFFARLSDFAFTEALMACKPSCDAEKVSLLLDSDGLGYGQKPKGVLLFHRYGNQTRTPAEEHLVEAANYAQKKGEISVHFTVSPQHLELFKAATEGLKNAMEAKEGAKVNITYSFQKPSTDTLAATMDNQPFRDAEGNLVFRPGGHGALIENLNDLAADYVFIKNIDNVAQEHLLPTTIEYKRLIAGYAIERKNKIDSLLQRLDESDASAVAEAKEFMLSELKTTLPNDFDSLDFQAQKAFIFDVLDRPLRVCGMVKNEGEPGGGPFWVLGSDGQTTLQVVESAQIDTHNAEKAAIMNASTHFNPVDLFCCITNRKGEKYNLTEFVDKNAGFISYKSLGGKDLKAMELPGLWNGAMARWLTFFVEVPIETFNPVKTVMDLLRPAHQPEK